MQAPPLSAAPAGPAAMAMLPGLPRSPAKSPESVHVETAHARLTQLPPIDNINGTAAFTSIGLDWSAFHTEATIPGARTQRAVAQVKKELADKALQRSLMSGKSWNDWVLRLVTRYESKIEALEEELLMQAVDRGVHVSETKEVEMRRIQVKACEASIRALQQRLWHVEHGQDAVRSLTPPNAKDKGVSADDKEREFMRVKMLVQQQTCDLADAEQRIKELEEALQIAKDNEVPKIDPALVQQYEQQVYELTERVEELEEACETLEREMENAVGEKTKEIATLRKKLEHQQGEQQRHKDRIEELTRTTAAQQEKINDLEDQLRTIEIEKRALQQQNALAMVEIESLNERNEELQAYVTELENRRPPTPPPDVRPETMEAMLEFMTKHAKGNKEKMDTSNYTGIDEEDYHARLKFFMESVGNWLLSLEDQLTLGKASYEKEIKALKTKVQDQGGDLKRLKQSKKCMEEEIEAMRNALNAMKSATRRAATPDTPTSASGERRKRVTTPQKAPPNPMDRRDPSLPSEVRTMMKRMEQQQARSKQRWEDKAAAIRAEQRTKNEAALDHCTTAHTAAAMRPNARAEKPNNVLAKRMGYFGDGLRALKKLANGPEGNGMNFLEILMEKIEGTGLYSEDDLWQMGKQWVKRYSDMMKQAVAGGPRSDAAFVAQVYHIFVLPDYLKPLRTATQADYDAVIPLINDLEEISEEMKEGAEGSDGEDEPAGVPHKELLDAMCKQLLRDGLVSVEGLMAGITRYLVENERWVAPPDDDGESLLRLTADFHDFFLTLFGSYEVRFLTDADVVAGHLHDLVRQKGMTKDGPTGYLFRGQWCTGVELRDESAQTENLALQESIPPTMDTLRPLMDETNRRLSSTYGSPTHAPSSPRARTQHSIAVDESALSVSSAVCHLKDALARDESMIAEGAGAFQLFLNLGLDIFTQQLPEIPQEEVMACVSAWVAQHTSDAHDAAAGPHVGTGRRHEASVRVSVPAVRMRPASQQPSPAHYSGKLVTTTTGGPAAHAGDVGADGVLASPGGWSLGKSPRRGEPGAADRSFNFGGAVEDAAWEPAATIAPTPGDSLSPQHASAKFAKKAAGGQALAGGGVSPQQTRSTSPQPLPWRATGKPDKARRGFLK